MLRSPILVDKSTLLMSFYMYDGNLYRPIGTYIKSPGLSEKSVKKDGLLQTVLGRP